MTLLSTAESNRRKRQTVPAETVAAVSPQPPENGRSEHQAAPPERILSDPVSAKLANPAAGLTFPISPPPQVAIVIAGRNNGRYLREAIESALNQSAPCEVVYADDCSTDDSLSIALDYIDRGLRVLPSGMHLGVCHARNRGANATRAPYLIFQDADDILPADYAASHLKEMRPETPFCFQWVQAFGGKNTLWKTDPWETYDIWRQNQVSTTSLWARWAFDAAGQWQDTHTMWDWDLAIRAARYGTPALETDCPLLYRIHDQSISYRLNERDHGSVIKFKETIRRKNARLTVSCLLSGRVPGLLPAWLDALATSVRFADLKERPHLCLWLHDGIADQKFDVAALAAKFCDGFRSVEICRMDGHVSEEPGTERNQQVTTLLARYSAKSQSVQNCDLMWLVEDDILVPLEACQKLFAAATAGDVPPIAVSGVYKSRHSLDHLIGGFVRSGRFDEPQSIRESVDVDFVGTGCLMFWTQRPGTPKHWRPLCGPYTAHDWAWSEDVRQIGGKQRMIADVLCGHAQSETEVLWP